MIVRVERELMRGAGPVAVVVHNGNGRAGAAAEAGDALHTAGFEVAAVGDSGRADYATTLVISRPDDLPLAEEVAAALGYGEPTVGRLPPDTVRNVRRRQ